MTKKFDIEGVIEAARIAGYFDMGLLKGQFTQAQLRDLFAQLRKRGIPTEPPQQPEALLDRRTALTMVNALRTGTVPQCDLTPLSVGRTNLRGRLISDLGEVANGSPKVRFLNAPYGSGKTHSLWLLAETAFREGFAVSFVTLSRSSCPLNSMLSVYEAIVNGIHTNESRKHRGLERLLNRWIEIIQSDGKEAAQRRVAQLPGYLVQALAEYAGATCNPIQQNHARRLLVLDYLAGKRCSRPELRGLGLTKSIDEASALKVLEDLTILVRQLGFRGLCIFLDEAESVLSFGQGTRSAYQAYANLCQIVQTGPLLRNCYFIYAATPGFFDEYTEYWPAEPIKDSHIYPLEPLSESEYFLLAERICRIYGKAYGVQVPVQKVTEVAKPLLQVLNANGSGSVSDFVRSIIAILGREKDV